RACPAGFIRYGLRALRVPGAAVSNPPHLPGVDVGARSNVRAAVRCDPAAHRIGSHLRGALTEEHAPHPARRPRRVVPVPPPAAPGAANRARPPGPRPDPRPPG